MATLIAVGLAVATFAPAAQAGVPAFALSNNSLVPLDTDSPGQAATPVAVTGLSAGDTLVGIDFRPQNGFLYGLGYNSAAGTVRLYHVSHRTGVATPIGATGSFVAADGATPVPVMGTNFGFDFNPTVDRVRVVNDVGQNFRINPNTGAFIDGDVINPGLNMDGAINGATIALDATAYTNDQANATVTTQYTLGAGTNQLFIQNPPNNGTQTIPVSVTLNGAPLDFTAANGFDVLPRVDVSTSNSVASGVGYAALSFGGTASLYTIDLASGAASALGTIGGGGAPIQGLAVQGEAFPGGLPAIALDADGGLFLRFNTGGLGSIFVATSSGLAAGETLVGVEWRPQTGQLYALGVNAGANTATLYLIDPQTGAAIIVGTGGQIAFVNAIGNPVDLPDISTGYGFDFNPTVDRIRVVTNNGLNFRVNPSNGAPVDGNAGVSGIQTDGTINGLPPGATGVSGAAYTNSFGQSLVGGVTTQYVLEPSSNRLFVQNPPNNGTLVQPGLPVTLDGAALDIPPVNGFDIPAAVGVISSAATASGPAYAALPVGAGAQLYRIELGSGVASLLGALGAPLGGLALGDGPPPANSSGLPASSSSSSPPATPLRAFGSKTLVTLKLAKQKTGPKGPVKIQIHNKNDFPVGGELSARPALKPKSKSLQVAAKGKQTIDLKLPKALTKLLERKGRLTLRLTATLRDPAGNERSVKATVTPKLRKRKRG